MRRQAACILVTLFLLELSTGSSWTPRAQDYASTRSGTVDGIARVEGEITLNVTIEAEQSQPSDPELSTGTPDDSEVTSFTTGSTQVVAGMPVSLVITRDGATFSPVIGSVESVVDATHCVVRVDPAALEQTWQDPSDANNVHKVGEYLSQGAAISLGGVTTQ
jgi:hypothetical protein